MVNDICIRCRQRRKRKNYQFCSPRCTQIAAKMAPRLIRVPMGHVMYNDLKKSFKSNWHSKKRLPTIKAIYLVTWTKQMRESFDKYREKVAKRSKPKFTEVKRFRSERRACHLGDSKQMKPCQRNSCWLCKAIRTGFKTSLAHKRNAVRTHAKGGIRFGGGIYVAPSSFKATEYAVNLKGTRSPYVTVLSVRTVLGKIQTLHKEEHNRMKPDKGYDSVQARAKHDGNYLEQIVYTADAIRPAYLIMLKK